MDIIKKVFLTFIYVIAGITISAAIFITLFVQGFVLSGNLLWQIIGMAAICSMGNFIYYSKRELSKPKMIIRIICHYLYINVIVLGGAIYWKWLQPEFVWQVIAMLILIIMVYAVVTIVSFRREARTAQVLNMMLKKNEFTEDSK
ncbi:MAG: hypothetical protein K0S01_1994 [Herbinix sp.]|jgi:hypothetical protein|nr:hypothetical protein [Herbinix sp.]